MCYKSMVVFVFSKSGLHVKRFTSRSSGIQISNLNKYLLIIDNKVNWQGKNRKSGVQRSSSLFLPLGDQGII